MTDKSLDLTGVGEVAKAIPAKAWTRVVDTACNTFEQCLAPLTVTTSGIGRLIEARFDRLVGVEKILAADILESATNRAKAAVPDPSPAMKANVVIAVLEEASTETDINLRELWANLLAQEIVAGDVHPEVARILSRLSAQEAQLLAKIAETRKDNTFQMVLKSFAKALDSSLAVSNLAANLLGTTLYAKRRRHSGFSEALLENLGLIERFEDNWVVSAIGEEFIRSVAGPSADAI
jgi:hypothetical protein